VKSSFKSFGIFSLAPKSIPQRKIASSPGKIVAILPSRYSRAKNILFFHPIGESCKVSIVLVEVEKYIPEARRYFLYENPSKSSIS